MFNEFKLTLKKITITIFAGSSLLTCCQVVASEIEPKITLSFPQLKKEVNIIYDNHGVPHIYAKRRTDLFFAMGYVHARDRFFQMDYKRHLYQGKSAELLGPSSLGTDIAYRHGLVSRWARQSMEITPNDILENLEYYAKGVNAFILDPKNPLPAEYAALNLTRESIKPWSSEDCFITYQGTALFDFKINFDDFTATQEIQSAIAAGFSSERAEELVFFDLHKGEPVWPVKTVPFFFEQLKGLKNKCPLCKNNSNKQDRLPPFNRINNNPKFPISKDLLESGVNILKTHFGEQKQIFGSNLFAVAKQHTATGHTLVANDPHVGDPQQPAYFYEMQTVLDNDPQPGTTNLMGHGLCGVPGYFMARTEDAAYAFTTSTCDTMDWWFEKLVLDDNNNPIATIFDGKQEPLIVFKEQFFANIITPNAVNNIQFVTNSDVFLTQRDRVLFPIIDTSTATATSFRNTLMGPIRDLEGLGQLSLAKNVADVKAAIRKINGFALNCVWTDTHDNIAYFTTGAIPIRADLQILGHPDGVGPNQIRDGSNPFHDWLPVINPQPEQVARFEVMTQEEMPSSINPSSGFIVTCNNLPADIIRNNDPYFRKRPCGGAYYFAFYNDIGTRAGILTRLIESSIARGHKITFEDMEQYDTNNQWYNAEFLVPYVVAALEHAREPGAWLPLSELSTDAEIVEVVARFKAWGQHKKSSSNYTTTVGIPVIYDYQKPNQIIDPTPVEVQNSIATTIFNFYFQVLWSNTFCAQLTALGINCTGSGYFPFQNLFFLIRDFPERQGFGVSGINFVQVPGSPSQQTSLDYQLLVAIRDALAIIRSPALSPPYGPGTPITEMQWGKLDQPKFASPLGGSFNVPPAGGTSALTGAVGGIPFGNASDIVASPAAGYRMVRNLNREIFSKETLQLGQSADSTSPFFADQLNFWLRRKFRPQLYKKSEVNAHATSFIIMKP